jgi:hypothetical protein
VYPAGKLCSDYQDPNFTPVLVVDFGTDTAGKAVAEEACKDATTDYIKEICIFDYFVTRDAAFAQATLEAAITAERTARALSSASSLPSLNRVCTHSFSRHQLSHHRST